MAGSSETVQQRFAVEFAYPVVFTHGVFDPANPALADVLRARREDVPHRALVYIDDGVWQAWPDLPERVAAYLGGLGDVAVLASEPRAVPGGERAKQGWDIVRGIMTGIGDNRLCRHSFVIAIGGGSMLDMVGFAASIVHRGVRLIRLPTSVLAQADGGVGVKNGMDEHGVKNYVGSFAPPAAVINDYDFLRTLPDRYWRGGVSEAFKVAMIKDADFFDELCGMAVRLRARDARAIERVVRRTAELHLEHIRSSGDPFEFGTARPLDFGHWVAHKLEVLSHYTVSHGEAVAIGIAIDACYAASQGLLPAADRDRALVAMESIGLPLFHPLLTRRTSSGTLSVLAGLEEFREHLGGRLTVTLPDGIGRGREVHDMDHGLIEAAVRCLEDRSVHAP